MQHATYIDVKPLMNVPVAGNADEWLCLLQGMLMISPNNCATKETLVRLWVHESLRVFHDRLISAEDKQYFKGMIR